MALSVSRGAGTWAPAQDVSVADGAGNWMQAKSVKRSDGAGNWTIIWTPLSAVNVTGPLTSVSGESGNSGALSPIPVPSVFTVTIENIEPLSTVVLQQSNDAGTTWADIQTWGAPFLSTLEHPYILPTAGAWLIRAAATHLDGRITYSNLHAITSYTKNLTALTSNDGPEVFEPFTLTADCGAQCLPTAVSGQWWYQTDDGSWTSYGSATENPQEVYQPLPQPYEWTYQETYADGSIIYSSPVTVTSTALVSHFHEIVPAGGDIQRAMDRARDWFVLNGTVPVNFEDEATMACVELTAGAVYDIAADELFYRRGVRLIGNGATIEGHGTHIFKGDNNGGGGYNSPNRDWQIIDTILDCRNNCGGLSTAHVFRYRLNGVTIKNIGGGKHHIEVNSSGGPVETDYNVEILNSVFFQEVKSAGVRTEDEAIQLDYSWDGAAPNVASDGTVTNNVVVRGCTFYQLPRAIGGHVYNSKTPDAAGIHSHILIEGSTFTNINPMTWGDGSPNSSNSEGAVRNYYWKDLIIQDNTFQTCFQPVMVYAPDDADGAAYNMGQTTIRRNVFDNCCVPGRHAAYGGSGGNKSIGTVLFEDNILRGTWGGGPDGYFAGFDNTSGTLPGSSNGVIISGNRFEPVNYDVVGEADYNKYRNGNATNLTPVSIVNNTISDGSVDNS